MMKRNIKRGKNKQKKLIVSVLNGYKYMFGYYQKLEMDLFFFTSVYIIIRIYGVGRITIYFSIIVSDFSIIIIIYSKTIFSRF